MASTTQPASAAQLPRIDLEGLRRLVREADEQNRVLVVDFWATWCVPCVHMFPGLHGGLKELGDRVSIVSVTLDAPGKLEEKAVAFLGEHDALHDAYMLVPDSDTRLQIVEAVGEQWNDLVVPAILVYGPDGKLAGEFLGSDQVDPILSRVRELLQGDPSVHQHENGRREDEQGV